MKTIFFFLLICLSFVACKTSKTSQNQVGIKQLTVNDTVKPSELQEFKATAFSTNFTVPLLRYNPLIRNTTNESKIGNISFFNSIGAGIGVYMGTLRIVTDQNKKIIDRELVNTFGIQLGFLFSASNSTGSTQNVFAPTLAFSLLNFQIGYGYELGTKAKDEHNGFFTIAYGIPVSKLIRGGFYVFRRSPQAIASNASGFIGD